MSDFVMNVNSHIDTGRSVDFNNAIFWATVPTERCRQRLISTIELLITTGNENINGMYKILKFITANKRSQVLACVH